MGKRSHSETFCGEDYEVVSNKEKTSNTKGKEKSKRHKEPARRHTEPAPRQSDDRPAQGEEMSSANTSNAPARSQLQKALQEAQARMAQVEKELEVTQKALVKIEGGHDDMAGYVGWWPMSFELEYGALKTYVPPPHANSANVGTGEGDQSTHDSWSKGKGKGDGWGKGGKGKDEVCGKSGKGKGKGEVWGRGGKGKGDEGGKGKGDKGSNGKGKSKGKSKGEANADHTGASKKIYQHGNYPRYYQYRKNEEGAEDPRLGCLKQEWFVGKDMLDIGCHCGDMTLMVATKFGARSVVGVEVDHSLARQAQENARLQKEKVKAHFMCENFVETPMAKAPLYDVVMCLSVSKWIHFNAGDAGIKQMFAKVFAALRSGGVFILEPQPWKSYKSKYAWTEEWKANYHAIELKPGLFKHYLCDQVGFASYDLLSQGEGSDSFKQKREMYAFYKK